MVTKEDTTILNGGGDRAAVAARAEDIRREIEEIESDWDREKLQERLAHLVGGIAVIRVGAATETELKERKSRVEDALAAVRAALEDGYVVGGGVALLRAASAIDTLLLDEGAAHWARMQSCAALQEPLRIIAQNGGFDGPTVAQHVGELTGDEGFDARTGEYADLVKSGVIDPTKVVVSALSHATSIATMVLTTEALIADAPEPEQDEAGGGHGHGHGGGMDAMGGMGGMGGGMGMGDDLDF